MKIRIRLLIVVLLFGYGKNSWSQPVSEKLPLEQIKKITNEEATAFLKGAYTNVSGVVYLGGSVYQFHFGKLSNGKFANDQTLYEIGSITKTYTGILLSQAVEDKKVLLDVDVRTYLKGNYPNLQLSPDRPITLKQLITHTSGFPPVINCGDPDQTIDQQIMCYDHFTKEDFFKQLKTVNLIDTSGNNYHYSNAGVQLVGYILENIYQSSFQELIKKFIFSRSQERNTKFKEAYVNDMNISLGKNSQGISMPLINGFYNYAGGLKSSTSSMLRYIKMYLDSNDPVVRRTMGRLAGTVQYGRAYAWNTYNFDQKRKMLYHNGGTLGHSSWITLYPNQKAGIFLATNILTKGSQGDLNELSNRIMDKLLK